jgi:hypothetical protein
VSTADWGPFKSNAIRWAGGQTTDVVTYLDDQLNVSRGRRTHHPPSLGEL